MAEVDVNPYDGTKQRETRLAVFQGVVERALEQPPTPRIVLAMRRKSLLKHRLAARSASLPFDPVIPTW